MRSFFTGLAALSGLASALPAGSLTSSGNSTENNVLAARGSSSYWYANMDHTGNARGYVPNLDNNDYTYPVYKAVASGDCGGIQDAIDSDGPNGDRDGGWIAGQPRTIYLPPGLYSCSSAIQFKTDTVLMGDPTNPPIIQAASGFNGDTLFIGKDAKVGGGESSFSSMIKNVIFDTTLIDGGSSFTALNWRVAQNSALVNVKITMAPSSNGNGHTGIFMGQGSTISVSDFRVEHGQHGVQYSSHQQALFKNAYFYQNTIGFYIDQYGGSLISIVNPTFDTCGQGVNYSGGSPWVAIIDGTSINSGNLFVSSQYPNFMIENHNSDAASVKNDLVVVRGSTVLSGQAHVDTFVYGNTVDAQPVYQTPNPGTSNPRPTEIAPNGKYFTATAPSYEDLTVADFVNVKDSSTNGGRTVKGDNTLDEAGVLQDILNMAAQQNKVVYFPFGIYRVESTLVIPPGSRIVGEAWATITGDGDAFKDENHPTPIVMVGEPNSSGSAVIQDMRFTVNNELPGAIIVQVNMAGAPGDVAIFNSLITIGGTRDTSLSCGDSSNHCKSNFIGMHLSTSSSAYIDNVWVWVADHASDGSGKGTSSASKGGVLVEATKGTWLVGLGSEHHWLYNLNLHNAENVFQAFFQSETNYEQGSNAPQLAPAPWTADTNTWGDPDFSWCGGGDSQCRMTLGEYINGGKNIFHYAAGSWAFFSGPGYQGCGDWCQDYMYSVPNAPENFQAYGFGSKSSQYIIRRPDGSAISQNPDFTGCWTGLVADWPQYNNN